MKYVKLAFLFFFLGSVNVYARQIVLDIPDNDIKIVENDVMDAEQWIREAWAGKLANCKSRLVKQEIQESVSKNETIPAGEGAIVQKAFTRPNYKKRAEKENLNGRPN